MSPVSDQMNGAERKRNEFLFLIASLILITIISQKCGGEIIKSEPTAEATPPSPPRPLIHRSSFHCFSAALLKESASVRLRQILNHKHQHLLHEICSCFVCYICLAGISERTHTHTHARTHAHTHFHPLAFSHRPVSVLRTSRTCICTDTFVELNPYLFPRFA